MMNMTLTRSRSSTEDTDTNGILIPGLPDDVATLCMVRISHIYHSSMRSVSLQWRKLVDNPSFLSLRKELGFANSSLFLIPKNPHNPYEVKCWQVDLDSQLGHSYYPCFRSGENAMCTGERPDRYVTCVAVGRLVMLIGENNSSASVPDVYVLNTLTERWTKGAKMLNPQHNYAYGVIEGRLYVVGGSNQECYHMRESEVFDPHTNTWTPIASLPVDMLPEQFFVMEGRLFVYGEDTAFVYDPLRDLWQSQQWLADACHVSEIGFVGPFERDILDDDIGGFMVVTCKDNSIYYMEVIEDVYSYSSVSTDMHICRYDKSSSMWEDGTLFSFKDQHPTPSVCSQFSSPNIFGFMDKVLIMVHLEDFGSDDETYRLNIKTEDSVMRVAVKCPDEWYAAIVYF